MRDRNLMSIRTFLAEIDPILVLELPNLCDKQDSGKNLIHKCAHVKSEMILEEMVETYRKVYVKLMKEKLPSDQ